MYDFELIPLENSNTDIANEDYLFNQTPIFLNYDRWLNGNSKILYITGLSGSGKGWQAKQIADKVDNCIIFELDKFENYMWYLNEDENDKEHPAVARGDKVIFKYLKDNFDLSTDIFDNNVEKYKSMIKDLYAYLLDYVKSNPDHHYIMEGIQLYTDDAFDSISTSDSVIILRTSMVKSMQKVMSRKHCEIRNHLHTFIDYQQKLREFEKRFNIKEVKIANENIHTFIDSMIINI